VQLAGGLEGVDADMFPGAHARQAEGVVMLGKGWYFPAAQFVQMVLLNHVPGGHKELQVAEPGMEKPKMQGRQAWREVAPGVAR